MKVKKVIEGNVLCLYAKNKCIYERNIDNGKEKVIDFLSYNFYTSSFREVEVENTNELVYVRALLTLKSSEGGGRETGVVSGYRPNHIFNYEDPKRSFNTFIGDVNFEHKKLFMPGESHEVLVCFLFFQPIEKYLNLGKKWSIFEGGREVGEAEMLEISLNKITIPL